MTTEIRICSNCGAGVVGTTTNCPRCDYPLPDEPIEVIDGSQKSDGTPAQFTLSENDSLDNAAEHLFETEAIGSESGSESLLPDLN
ncbi:MAG TPA: hypothetical protein VJZ27_13855 [Aggregatilineales bacterium]|nr:hypothetical protein [Aggregatilineales bacterium]